MDASNPANPTLLGTFKKEHAFLLDAVISEDRAYLAATEFIVLNISDPSNPQEVGSCETAPGNAPLSLAVHGDYAYVAYGEAGVIAADTSDASNPGVAAHHDSLGSAARVFVHDDLAYVADKEGGLLILDTLAEAKPSTAVRQEKPATLSRREPTRARALHRRPVPPRPAAPLTNRAGAMQPRAASRDPISCLVTSSVDSGPGSLRRCLETVEEGDSIHFDSSAFPPQSPVKIALATPLPVLGQHDLTIDASDAGVIVSGEALTQHGNGVHINSDRNRIMGLQTVSFPGTGVSVGGANNIIGGNRKVGSGPSGQGNVISGNKGNGVQVHGSSNTVCGNLIGLDATGNVAMPNGGTAVHVFGNDNQIGGDTPGTGNVIAGHSASGVSLHFGGAHGNSVVGNYVGTDVSGTTALENARSGIDAVQGAFDNLIARNVISGHSEQGISLDDPGSSYNVVSGNIIGLDASGTRTIGNAAGVVMGFWGATFNRVGGASPEERNVVSGNRDDGVGAGGHNNLVLGNFIGTDLSGTTVIGKGVGVSVGGHNNLIGGASGGAGNLISGNKEGIRLNGPFRNNWIAGNRIGVDSSGAAALPNTVGVHLAAGGPLFIQRNSISRNASNGLVIEAPSGNNILRANMIGTGSDGVTPVPNQRSGVVIESDSNQVGGLYPEDGNIIANNGANGIQVLPDEGNTILGNSIFANGDSGIRRTENGNQLLPPPTITLIWPGSVWGTTCSGCTVEVFSDEGSQGRILEGRANTDVAGAFVVRLGSSLTGPYLTATATDQSGSTSEFSEPMPLSYSRRVRKTLSSLAVARR